MIKITFPDGTECSVKTSTDAIRLLKTANEGLNPELEEERKNWRAFDNLIKSRLEQYTLRNKESDIDPSQKFQGCVPAYITYIRGLCRLRAAAAGIPITNTNARHTAEELDFYMQAIDDILPEIKQM